MLISYKIIDFHSLKTSFIKENKQKIDILKLEVLNTYETNLQNYDSNPWLILKNGKFETKKQQIRNSFKYL